MADQRKRIIWPLIALLLSIGFANEALITYSITTISQGIKITGQLEPLIGDMQVYMTTPKGKVYMYPVSMQNRLFEKSIAGLREPGQYILQLITMAPTPKSVLHVSYAYRAAPVIVAEPPAELISAVALKSTVYETINRWRMQQGMDRLMYDEYLEKEYPEKELCTLEGSSYKEILQQIDKHPFVKYRLLTKKYTSIKIDCNTINGKYRLTFVLD